MYKRALEINEKAYGPDHPDVALSLNNLALLYNTQGRYAEAEPMYKRALEIKEKAYGPDHPDVATTVHNLAFLRYSQGEYGESEKLANRATKISDGAGIAPGERFLLYDLRAMVHWKLDNKDQAVADLQQAMDLAEEARADASGAARERAGFFGKFASAFERMVRWQVELGGVDEALSAMERSRARALVDQMATHGIDLLAGVPEEEARRLRGREAAALTAIAGLERQIELSYGRDDLTPQKQEAELERLRGELRAARAEYVEAYAAIRNASPAYRLAVGQDRKPVALERLREWVAKREAVLLEYLIGDKGGYVLVVPPGGEPRLVELTLTDSQAEQLGTEAGPLTAAKMQAILADEDGTGVLQLVAASDQEAKAAAAVPKLAALWTLLIPEDVRVGLVNKKHGRLIVVPDATLARLSFETLVVRGTTRPVHLLDAGPPVEYGPSATVLVNLSERESGHKSPDRPPVLTVGNPSYRQAAPDTDNLLAALRPAARWGESGGQLKPLPYSGWEVAWVAEVFGRHGVRVAWLREDLATEAAVRHSATGRRILHLACHGLVDQSYGNLFGALALTPGSSAEKRPDDDGFLTLAEVYELKLAGTELTILSACDSNLGPEQRGEGVWALSRGFLVAGSRRVVASNWLVDDEAAANLVSVFCTFVARAEKEGEPVDYAESLRKAKRWVRNQEKWSSPYYWGTFALVGPN
jgi:tetratricopeptide (TPR) repeat protein